MNRYPGTGRTASQLYPPIKPFDQRMLAVGGGHRIHIKRCGNPDGLPVVVLHGGPGCGCSPAMRRYFNPEKYHIILFDQRGCGQSSPYAVVEHNTTWDLIADMEAIRTLFGIERWLVFGGSWGAALGLLYAQKHPQRALGLVLRGVFTMTQDELDWFYGGGAGQFWPEAWKRFRDAIPVEEQQDLIAAYHRRLFSGNAWVENRFAALWTSWENALTSISSSGACVVPPGRPALAMARIECHYFINDGFLGPDTQILAHTDRLRHIPGWIIQGRYDMICPPHTAAALADAWSGCSLTIVPLAGHAMSEPGIASALVQTTNMIAARM